MPEALLGAIYQRDARGFGSCAHNAFYGTCCTAYPIQGRSIALLLAFSAEIVRECIFVGRSHDFRILSAHTQTSKCECGAANTIQQR